MAEPTAEKLPPASLSILIATLATQATSALGLAPDPLSGKTEVKIELAKHVIDLLGVLESKTQGNRTADESALLESALHNLRIAYVQASKEK